MSRSNVTDREALRRLLAATKLIDYADCKDETVWQALGAAQGTAEGVLRGGEKQEPVMWYEADESARGADVREVIGGMIYSTRLHTKKPDTANPVWSLYASPQAPVAAVQGWISVDDKLPEQGAVVAALIYPYNNKENKRIVTHSEYYDGQFLNHEGDDLHPPTHWMPLPPAPDA